MLNRFKNQKGKAEQTAEILYLRPVQRVNFEEAGELIVLLKPKFTKGILSKWLQPRLKKPFFRIKLDEIGTFVWKNINGKNTVAEIAKKLSSEFGEKVHPAEERLKMFMLQMYKAEFVEFTM